MVFFEDTLEYYPDLRFGREANLVSICHYPSSDDNYVLIMADSSLRGELNNPEAWRDTQPIGYSIKSPDSFSDILPCTKVVLVCGDDDQLETPMEFILNYEDILTGSCSGWQLCAVEVYEDRLYMHYVNSTFDAMGQICITRCPRALWFEVPEPPAEAEDGRSALDRLFGREAPASYAPVKTSTVVVDYTDVDTMTIWTGDLRLGKESLQSTAPAAGQQMIRITPDRDKLCDRAIQRLYLRRDLNRDQLQTVLQPVANSQIFAL